MSIETNLNRFLEAQNQLYLRALEEIQKGKKLTNWMWFIFPQLKGLDQSEMSRLYAIENLQEAEAYIAHPILGKHLVEITNALLEHQEISIMDIFGTPDDNKFHSSMTLFANLHDSNPVFDYVLAKYFDSIDDKATLELMLLNNHRETQ